MQQPVRLLRPRRYVSQWTVPVRTTADGTERTLRTHGIRAEGSWYVVKKQIFLSRRVVNHPMKNREKSSKSLNYIKNKSEMYYKNGLKLAKIALK